MQLLFIYREAHKSEHMHYKVERVTESYGLSEGPHWDHQTQKLYFVDIYNQYVRRLDPATGDVTNSYIGKSTLFLQVSLLYIIHCIYNIS